MKTIYECGLDSCPGTTGTAHLQAACPSTEHGIALVTIDADLLTMIREARDVIVAHVPDYYDVPTWDRPWDLSWWDPAPSILTAGWHGRLREKAMELCHAIGFIAGCAATFDKTPCELLDLIA